MAGDAVSVSPDRNSSICKVSQSGFPMSNRICDGQGTLSHDGVGIVEGQTQGCRSSLVAVPDPI